MLNDNANLPSANKNSRRSGGSTGVQVRCILHLFHEEPQIKLSINFPALFS